jgi:hypothetical protein
MDSSWFVVTHNAASDWFGSSDSLLDSGDGFPFTIALSLSSFQNLTQPVQDSRAFTVSLSMRGTTGAAFSVDCFAASRSLSLSNPLSDHSFSFALSIVFDSNRGYSVSGSQSVSGLFQGSISFSIIAGENPGPTEDGNQNKSSDIISSSTGLLIGIIVGAVLLLLIAATISLLVFRRRNRSTECDSDVEMQPEIDPTLGWETMASANGDYNNPLSDAGSDGLSDNIFGSEVDEVKFN